MLASDACDNSIRPVASLAPCRVTSIEIIILNFAGSECGLKVGISLLSEKVLHNKKSGK